MRAGSKPSGEDSRFPSGGREESFVGFGRVPREPRRVKKEEKERDVGGTGRTGERETRCEGETG